jgi:5-methylcytosine-specific restriction enzyme subunit McrC
MTQHAMAVPVQHIYYVLCYAWDEFAPKQIERVASGAFPDALHLFASILDAGVRSLHQRGFETGYVTFEQPTRSPREEFSSVETARLVAAQPGRVCCTCDQVTSGSGPNIETNS